MFEVSKTGISNLGITFPSMEIGEIAKESLGLCRCCLAEGLFKDMTFEYIWMNQCEVYADMLLEALDIKISVHADYQTGVKRLICATCISRLREACNFKKQVLDSEKQFVSMLRSGEYRSYWQNTKVEIKLEAAQNANVDTEGTNLEDFHFGDDDQRLDCKKEHDASFPDEYIIADTTIVRKIKEKKLRSEINFDAKGKCELTLRKLMKQPAVEVKRKQSAREVKSGLLLLPKSLKSRNEACEPPKISVRKARLPPPKKTNYFYCIKDIDKQKHNLQTILKYSNVTPFIDKTLVGYLCGYCKDTFPDPQDLRSHTAMEHSKVRLDIQNTLNLYEYSVKLDITDLICTICNTDMKNLNALKDHLVKTHQQQIFDGISDYLLEFRLKKADRLDCALCTSTYETFKMLKQHMNKHYPNFVCDECHSPFVTKRSLFAHKRRHRDGSFKCSQCDKVFTTNEKRLYHEKLIHSGKKVKNNCAFCDLKFDNHYRRNLHLLNVHNVDPMYKCNICDRTFLTKALLTRHTKRDHLLERNYKCIECDYSCFRRRQLHNHMIKHSGERNYVCDVCKKAYGRKSTLREHMRIHNNDRRFKCRECGMKFVQKCSLRSHLLSTHSISLAACEITYCKSE